MAIETRLPERIMPTEKNIEQIDKNLDTIQLNANSTDRIDSLDLNKLATGTKIPDTTNHQTEEVVEKSDGTKYLRTLSNKTPAIHGLILSYNDTDKIDISSGMCMVDGRLVEQSSSSTLTLSSLVADTWYFIYVSYSSGSPSFSYSTTAPDKSDNDGGTGYPLIYWLDGTVYKRCIGAVLTDASSNILKFYQTDNYIQFDSFQLVADESLGNGNYNANIPAISQCGYFELYCIGTTSSSGKTQIRPAGSSGSYFTVVQAYGRAQYAFTKCFTNSNQQIEVNMVFSANTDNIVNTVGYWINIR